MNSKSTHSVAVWSRHTGKRTSVDVELEVDLLHLAVILGRRAHGNKTGTAKLFGGVANAKIVGAKR